ncbi:hypothetical protein [Paenibacillus elgii]|uniref:hypothetical protein n=1 Tax=Paenibacillus elgii TaxID=189691 RepID=UPI0012FB981E|nr:hypothetical protein [Paenibacillus elgii]
MRAKTAGDLSILSQLPVTIGASGITAMSEKQCELCKEDTLLADMRSVLASGHIIPAVMLDVPDTGGQKLLSKELFVLVELQLPEAKLWLHNS